MLLELPLRCRCGHMRGVASNISPLSGFRFVCYCTDCQAFARFLGRPDVLDPAGGTDIFQMPSARLTLTAGTDALGCVSFSSRVLRWYTACCQTPIANTARVPSFPVVGVIHSFMDHGAHNRPRDDALGPPICRLYERSATGPLPSGALPSPSLSMFVRRTSKVLRWWMRGLNWPTPFFDDRTKAPRATPRVLPPSERAAL